MRGSSSTNEEWKAYANGGVATDDARARQLRIKEDMNYTRTFQMPEVDASDSEEVKVSSSAEKLIELSPEKKMGLKNSNLLIDLDMDSDSQPSRQRYTETLVYRPNDEERAQAIFLD